MPSYFGLSACIPAHITVRFPTRRCNGTVSDTIQQYYIKIINAAELENISGSGNSAATKEFRDTALALFNVGVGTPSNQTALDDLAKVVAQDYCNWKLIHYDLVLNGIAALNLDATCDEASWYYGRSFSSPSDHGQPAGTSSVLPDCFTHIKTASCSGDPEELQHSDATAEAACEGVNTSYMPCVLAYSPTAKCVAGKLNIPVIQICLIDGRLVGIYVRTDTIGI